jgi:hypothetical protein
MHTARNHNILSLPLITAADRYIKLASDKMAAYRTKTMPAAELLNNILVDQDICASSKDCHMLS